MLGQWKRILLCPKHKAESENDMAQINDEQTYLGAMNICCIDWSGWETAAPWIPLSESENMRDF